MTTHKESLYEKHIQTILLALITAATIGAFRFLWTVNDNITILRQQSIQGERDRNQLQQSVNDVNIRLVDMRDRVLRLEDYKKK